MKFVENDSDIEKVRQQMLDNIERTGRALVGVFPGDPSSDPVNDAFVYTIGNGDRNLPELLIVGLYDDEYILNALSKMMLERGKPFEDGELVEMGGKCPACVVDAAESVKKRYTIQATSYHRAKRQKYRVMQVVLPDREGLFPWQRGCANPYSKVKVHRAKALN
jgi:hypothetical protein